MLIYYRWSGEGNLRFLIGHLRFFKCTLALQTRGHLRFKKVEICASLY